MNPLAVMARRSMSRFASSGDFTFGDWLSVMTSIDGPMFIGGSTLRGDEELPPATLEFLSSVYGRSSVVFSALQTRWKLFAQARYQFQQMFGGREGGLFGTPDLAPLEHPEPGETTLDLNFRAIQYADLAGDWFGVRRPASVVRPKGPSLPYGNVDRIKPLRPDWTVIVLGSRQKRDPIELSQDPDAEIIGFGYTPEGPRSGKAVIAYGREEVAHFHPNTGPLSRYRGMPLILAALPEILADNGSTSYKRAFMRNAATPNLAVSFPPNWDEAKAKSWLEQFEKKHRGATNAFKTMYLGGGMTVAPVGTNFKDMAYKDLAGTMETRLAAVVGMHPVIIPFSEGMAGSAMNAGNYGAAKRSTSDITLRYLWPNMCGSLETIIPAPTGGTRLWFDQRSVPFLQADVTDQASVMQANSETIGRLVNEGFTPASVVDYVSSGDVTRLVHTGLVSVQLQPPGNTLPAAGTAAPREFSLSAGRLRRMIGQGWTPATPTDIEIVRDALAGTTVSDYRATRRFWPASGPLSPEIIEGAILPGDDAMVLLYPSLFAPVGTGQVAVSVDSPARRLGAGPAPIVTTEEVLAKKAELEAAGRPAGYDTLAAEMAVSRDTIRRRLSEMTEEQRYQAQVQRDQAALLVALAGRSTTVASPVTIAPGAVQVEVNTPPTKIEPGAVQVDVHSAPVTIAQGAITSPAVTVNVPERSVEPAQVHISEGAVRIVEHVPTRTVIDRDPETNEITGTHEELLE